MSKRISIRILALLLAFLTLVLPALAEIQVDGNCATDGAIEVWFGEWYYTPDEVALYLHVFEELPGNYITEDDARDAGWVSSRGNLWDVFYGACLGGDAYQNREKLLPRGKSYEKCDVNYYGGFRGAERLVYSNDGYIYYTEDHYESFEPLYEGWYADGGDTSGYGRYDNDSYSYGSYDYGYGSYEEYDGYYGEDEGFFDYLLDIFF